MLASLATLLRVLSVDAVENAKSGHPGMPLGMADIASVLWSNYLTHNPKNPMWFNRDRFILSNGHGSALLYSLLHITGYSLTISDLKKFRKLHSKTPGHPEYRETPGVEATTGPLGQGIANGVGMALAEKILANQFNRDNFSIVDHWTYVFAGDGCLMEGISHEVCSFAGVHQLGKLILFYDNNKISIDGNVANWFNDDTVQRFKSYNWEVIGPIDGHDYNSIINAIQLARSTQDKPKIIICNTHIGLGSNKQDSELSHGSPLGPEGISLVRQNFKWSLPAFEIPEEYYKIFSAVEKGEKAEQNWLDLLFAYEKSYPEEYLELLRRMNADLPYEFNEDLFYSNLISDGANANSSMATRVCSQKILEILSRYMPELLSGSADLTHSNNTIWKDAQIISSMHETFNFQQASYIHYGVRELGMAAIMNGLTLHGGFLTCGGTFLVFADYAKSAIRLSALMKLRVIYILTHDSIGLGEDGPTHQPIEQASMLRYTPNTHIWRPADLLETAVAWWTAINRYDGPSCLLLSRQNIPPINRISKNIDNVNLIKKGGYIISDCEGIPNLIIMATGSEVALAIDVKDNLVSKLNNFKIRVVSMPCCEIFAIQDVVYQDEVLPRTVTKRVAIECSAKDYWYKWVGFDGLIIGLETFGASGTGAELMKNKGFTVEDISSRILNILDTI